MHISFYNVETYVKTGFEKENDMLLVTHQFWDHNVNPSPDSSLTVPLWPQGK